MKYTVRLYSESDKITIEEIIEANSLAQAIKQAIELISIANIHSPKRDFVVEAVTAIIE